MPLSHRVAAVEMSASINPRRRCSRLRYTSAVLTQNVALIAQIIVRNCGPCLLKCVNRANFICGCFKLALVISLFFLNFLHESTYVWQSTVGKDFLTPVLRKSCDLHLPPGSPAILPAKPKIAIVVLYGGDWPSGLMQRVMENKEFYAKYHGYTLVNANAFVDYSRPVAWSKLLAVESTLNR